MPALDMVRSFGVSYPALYVAFCAALQCLVVCIAPILVRGDPLERDATVLAVGRAVACLFLVGQGMGCWLWVTGQPTPSYSPPVIAGGCVLAAGTLLVSVAYTRHSRRWALVGGVSVLAGLWLG